MKGYALVVFLTGLAVGCGAPSSGPSPIGGGQGSGLMCTNGFSPCGGNVVGTWVYGKSCGEGAVCPGTKILSETAPNLTVTFGADGRLQMATTSTGSLKYTAPASCFSGGCAATQGCAYASTAGGGIGGVGGVGGIGGTTGGTGDGSPNLSTCECTVAAASSTGVSTASYSTNASASTITIDGAQGIYCVAGEQLLITGAAFGNSFGHVILTRTLGPNANPSPNPSPNPGPSPSPNPSPSPSPNPSGLTCGQLIECANNCTSQACLTQCNNSATTTARSKYQALGACIGGACETTGRCADPSAQDCSDCVYNTQASFDGSTGVGQCAPTSDLACGQCVTEGANCNNDI